MHPFTKPHQSCLPASGRNFVRPALLVVVLASPAACLAEAAESRSFDLAAKDTLTVVRMNHGDVLRFRLRNGQARAFRLEATEARIVERVRGGIVYSFECRLQADGQPLVLRRYVCSQETFYEPWVVNGVRLWLSSSAAIFKLVPIRYPEQHDKLEEDAVLALQDATLPICPQPMRLWFPIDRHYIDVGQCYNGDDPWLGPYLGEACHMGLDINMPKGTPLYAPIDFDDQWIFSADHRWRGVRRWDNGDIWALQSHHVDRLLIPERRPLKAGVHYAEAAGKGVGSHPHSHFEFRLGPGVLNRGALGGTEIDPWILFWQMFETDKDAKGEIRAAMAPLAPAAGGQPVRFSAAGSRAGRNGQPLRFYWAFGDGCWSSDPAPNHTYLSPGIYPVTLVVDDGKQRATHTQHITIRPPAGPSSTAASPPNSSTSEASPPSLDDRPALRLHAPHEVAFHRRPTEAADVYGWPVHHVPHTLRFTAIPGGRSTAAKVVELQNAGQGVLAAADPPRVVYHGDAADWLRLALSGQGNQQRLAVAVDPGNLSAGRYGAVVSLHCAAAVNATQGFRVELNVRPAFDDREVIVDDRDAACYATPYFWVGHQFIRSPQRGHQKRYLTNGQRADDEAIVRFTPDLPAGRYEILLHPQTPPASSSYNVRVRHAAGEQTVRVEGQQAAGHSLGEFDFADGTDGFVEIQARDGQGLVIADAVLFRRVGRSTR
jgi:hypothetical protein